MSTVALALGAFRFALLRESYQSARHRVDIRWDAQNRAGGPPALHAAGIGAETLELEGVMFPSFHGTIRFPQALRAAAEAMTPQLMIDGVGFWWGRWVIRAVEEEATLHLANGAPRRQTWRLSLQRYVGPEAGTGLGGGVGAVADAARGAFGGAA